VTTQPRDELRSAERRPSTRGRLAVAAFVVLALAVVAIATLRPDRQGVGTPLAGASASSSPIAESPSPEPTAAPSPSPSPSPSSSPAPVPPPLRLKTGARLLVVQGTRLEVADLDSGGRTRLATDPRLQNHDRLDAMSVAGQLVLLGDDQTGAGNGPYPAYATTTGPGSFLRAIGRASSLFPSDRAGRLWLTADDDGAAGEKWSEVDVHGVVHRKATFRSGFGVKPFGPGFLRGIDAADGSAGSETELVDGVGRRLRLFAGRDFVASSGRTAVLAERSPCARACDLSILTAGTSVRERHLEVDEAPSAGYAVLSPDGSSLYVTEPANGVGGGPSELSEIHLTDGSTLPVPGAFAASFFGPSMRFTPDGRWVFFVDADEVHVDAWDRVERQAYRVNGSFARITQLELLP
jgi:hypothetical protein